MVLVVVRDPELARQVGESVAGRKWYETRPRGRDDLLRRAGWAKPRVVLADVRFGGHSWRVTEALSELLCLPTRPELVLLSPWRSEPLRTSAAVAGVFGVVDLDDPAWPQRLAETTELALAVQAEKAGLGPRASLVRH